MSIKNIKSNHISIGLLTLIASSMIWMNTQFISFSRDNSKEHAAISKALNNEVNFTHSIHTYEIKPNTKKIEQIDEEILDHEKRIGKLENKQ